MAFILPLHIYMIINVNQLHLWTHNCNFWLFTLCVFCTIIISCSLTSRERIYFVSLTVFHSYSYLLRETWITRVGINFYFNFWTVLHQSLQAQQHHHHHRQQQLSNRQRVRVWSRDRFRDRLSLHHQHVNQVHATQKYQT